jgi:hypothetical protein
VQFELRISGGVAGIARRAIKVDTSVLDSARAREIEALAERARVFERGAALEQAVAPDELGYELRVEDGGRHARIEFGYRWADESLRTLIQALRRT